MSSLKIVIVGDGCCGKTALLLAMMHPDLKCNLQGLEYIPTVLDNFDFTLNFYGVNIDVAFYDTSGIEDFDRLRPLSYPDTDVVLLCFSIPLTDALFYVNDKWIPEIRHFIKNVPIILVGTKSDFRDGIDHLNRLETDRIPVQQNEIEDLCKCYNLEYYATSAQTGDGVKSCLFAAVAAGMTFKYRYKKIPYAIQKHLEYLHGNGRSILRPFIVDRIIPTIKKDWETFGVYIGYDKKTLKLTKDKRVNHPFWQILRNWTETVEYMDVDPLKILYQALSKVNKSLKRDLMELIVRKMNQINIHMRKGIVDCLTKYPYGY